ncbi:hypothetical protein N7495_009411 [Penicillium taxi]|uniref:uncharacterized protein n=1 Tax=Penicillium taxi TaxID=168475 RepID=UPI00254590B1|nr:uncharacterized protein N7495_009411 [Penicillium taxi]KAJ5884901.1 hypothetical protein N7495_009411 [Penicillium taxi]
MPIPISTITTFRTTFNPFSAASRPCRLFLSLLRTPTTTSTGSIDIQVTQLPRTSTQQPIMTVGFKGGKEVVLEVGKRGMKIDDCIEEVSRVGRALEREASLKG